jgi:hypothetical protein
MSKEEIIDCAFSKGFKLPKSVKKRVSYFDTDKYGENCFPSFKYERVNLTKDDITVWRAKTNNFAGNKDLGEWWVSYPQSLTQFRVTDEDMNNYLNQNKDG